MALDQIELDRLLARRPDTLDDPTAQITPAIYTELKTAVELRKFGDGSRLSQEQLENCLQLVILYEAKQMPEHERTGFDIPVSCKTQQAVVDSLGFNRAGVSGTGSNVNGNNGAGNSSAGNNPVQMWGKD